MGVLLSCCRGGSIPSKRVIAKYGKWEKPSEQVAESSTLYFRSHHESFPIMKTSVVDLHEFGEGHTLYFFFLQSISRLFFFLFLISGLPTTVISILSNFYESNGGAMDKLTLGNVGHFHAVEAANLTDFVSDSTNVGNENVFTKHFRNLHSGSKAVLVDGGSFTKEDAVIIASILDGFGALVFFFAVLWLARIQNQLSAQVESRTVTVADYSIRVENLPPDTASSELKDFFSRWGEVLSTEIVKTDCELIERARIDKKMAEDMKVAIAYATQPATKSPNGAVSALRLVKIKILEIRKEKADTYTRRLYDERRFAKAVCAFVTMEKAEHRLALINSYPNSFGRRLFMRKNKRFRRTHRIKAVPAPEPADIIWENLQFRFFPLFFRRCGTTIIKYLALMIGFIFINIATSLRHNNPATMRQAECDNQCGYYDDTLTDFTPLNDPIRDTYKQCYKSNECSELESSCYQCYCERAIIEGLYRDESSYCDQYLEDFATSTVSELLSVIGVVFVNLSLVALATKLTQVERHHTRIRQETSLAHTLFIFQFINTAISYLVATTHIPRLSQMVEGTGLEGKLFVGVFVDTTPNWYKEVGRSLTITMIVQSGSRLVRVGVRWLLFKWKSSWRGSALTQHQMNNAFIGPEFTLAPRYGELLNLIFVTMFFGGGIPILYLVTAVSFSVQFVVEKAELLRLSQRPTSFGPDLAHMVSGLLPYATLWHFVFSAWAFSLQWTTRSPAVSESSEKTLEWIEKAFHLLFATSEDSNQAREFGNRMMQVTSAHHVVLFIVVALLLLIKVTMSLWIAVLKKLLSLLGCIKDTGLLNGTDNQLPDIASAIRSGVLIGPTTYALKSNPKYLHSLPTRNWNTEDLEVASEAENERKPLISQLSLS